MRSGLGRLGVLLLLAWTGVWTGRSEADDDATTDPAARPVLVAQVGHGGDVYSVAFSPDETFLLTGADDGTARLWEAETGRVVRRFAGHEEGLSSVAFSPNGRHVLTGASDGTARLWETSTGKEVRRFDGHAKSIQSVAFSPDGSCVLTGSMDKTARLWETAAGREVRRFEGHESTVWSVAFSPDGTHVLTGAGEMWSRSGTGDNTARLWETATGKEACRYEGHSVGIRCAVFAPDARYVLTASKDKTARLWETATGREVRRYEGHASGLMDAGFAPDGKRILTAAWDNTIRLWDTGTGREVRRFTYEEWEPPLSIAFSRNGRHVLLAASFGARLCDTESGREIRRYGGQGAWVEAASLSPDGAHLLTASADRVARLWDTATGQEVRRFEGHESIVEAAVFSPDGRYVLTGAGDHSAHLWELATAREVRRYEAEKHAPVSLAFSPDGIHVLTGDLDEAACLWEEATGREVRRYAGHGGGVYAVAFSPRGTHILTGSIDKTARLWEMATAKEIRRFEGHESSVESVAFSPDGSRVLTGSWTDARLWSRATGKELRRFGEAGHWVNSAAFSPDGRHVLTASSDKAARLWDSETGKEVRRYAGHLHSVQSAVFSADGRHVVTASWDGTTRLWEASTGAYLCSLISFSNGSWAVVTPDGRFDTGDLDRIEGLHWVLPDEPLRTYPIDIFMRDYYEPRLMARLLAGEKLPEVRDLTSLNRVQPAVQIAKVEPMAEGASMQRVTIQVKDVARTLPGRKGVTHSGAEDLRLFRDGRLVAWKDGPLELKDGKATVVFDDVPLWAAAGQKNVELSAYAFNVDRVKSETARIAVPLPADRSAATRTTYLIAMGVDVFDQPEWNLAYAAADAKALLDTLGKRFEQVVPVLLTSEREGPRRAAKKNLAAALAEVAKKAKPQDLVLITISTHGVSARDGEFYLLPSDVAKRDDQGTWLASCISAAELTTWLRPIDAEMVMVVDACQSAASVAKAGFKPGPMGSRGLGQLAYSKKMRILAASQAAEVALESGQIQHGLLTYALTTDGLEKGRADFEPKDGKVLLGEWLKYAERRVPTLAAEVHKGAVRAVARGGKVRREQTEPARLVQTPALFDFAKRTTDVVLVGR